MKSAKWALTLSGTLLLLALGSSLARSTTEVVYNHQTYLSFISLAPTPTPTPTPPPPPPTSPPAFSTSYYVDTVSTDVGYNLGCNLGKADQAKPGKQEQMVVLDFGTAKYKFGTYGASAMWRVGFVRNQQIADFVYQVGRGYWYCTGKDYDSHLQIAIGTNNYTATDGYASVTREHGMAWADMVNSVQQRFLTQCPNACNGQVDAVGASDMELAWNTAPVTIAWVQGYLSRAQYPLYNFGALEGCPYFALPGARCANGWSKDQVLQITTGFINPVPEIYLENGVHAQQWYLMSLYAFQKTGKPFDFAGTMTQYQACQQYGGCAGIKNTPEQGWRQLFALVNGDLRTYDSITYSTDIRWLDAATSPPNGLRPDDPNLSVKDAGEEPQLFTDRPGVDLEEAILEGSGELPVSWEGEIANMWEGYREGVPMRVLAGESADPRQGLLVVFDPTQGSVSYLAPGQTGSLRIQSVTGSQVVLQDAGGNTLIFDLLARSFQ